MNVSVAAFPLPTITGADFPASQMMFHVESELMNAIWAIEKRGVLTAAEIAELIEVAMIAGAAGERARRTEDAARPPSRRECEAAKPRKLFRLLGASTR